MPPGSVSVVRWVAAAVYALLASAAMYAWGAWHILSVAMDVEEKCAVVYHERWDPAHGQPTWVPLGRRCNASFDMVPAYVNPAVVALLVAAVVCAGLAVRAARRLSAT
jgi:hypothetical protein